MSADRPGLLVGISGAARALLLEALDVHDGCEGVPHRVPPARESGR